MAEPWVAWSGVRTVPGCTRCSELGTFGESRRCSQASAPWPHNPLDPRRTLGKQVWETTLGTPLDSAWLAREWAPPMARAWAWLSGRWLESRSWARWSESRSSDCSWVPPSGTRLEQRLGLPSVAAWGRGLGTQCQRHTLSASRCPRRSTDTMKTRCTRLRWSTAQRAMR